MLRYSLVLLATIAIFSGCDDGECCGIERETAANVAPVAAISGFTATCTADETVNVSGSTSTDDSGVSSYTWTPASIVGENGTFTCPASGSQEICLTVTDDDGLASTQECKTITVGAVVPDPVAVAPTAIITAGECADANQARMFSCSDSLDNDSINPSPDKGRTDTSIVKCEWRISEFVGAGEIPHDMTYVTFLTDGGVDVANSTTTNPKEVSHTNDYKTITLTVFDDDDQNNTITKKFDYTIGTCGDLVDP